MRPPNPFRKKKYNIVMSFNKYYIPEPADLAKLVIKNGPKSTVNRKIDAIIGNSTSIKIFDFMYDRVHEGLSDAEIIPELSKKFPEQFNAKSN